MLLKTILGKIPEYVKSEHKLSTFYNCIVYCCYLPWDLMLKDRQEILCIHTYIHTNYNALSKPSSFIPISFTEDQFEKFTHLNIWKLHKLFSLMYTFWIIKLYVYGYTVLRKDPGKNTLHTVIWSQETTPKVKKPKGYLDFSFKICLPCDTGAGILFVQKWPLSKAVWHGMGDQLFKTKKVKNSTLCSLLWACPK